MTHPLLLWLLHSLQASLRNIVRINYDSLRITLQEEEEVWILLVKQDCLSYLPLDLQMPLLSIRSSWTCFRIKYEKPQRKSSRINDSQKCSFSLKWTELLHFPIFWRIFQSRGKAPPEFIQTSSSNRLMYGRMEHFSTATRLRDRTSLKASNISRMPLN